MKEGEPQSRKDKKFLAMAMGVATQSKARFRHGAVVVRHSKVLGASPNINKNNPRYVSYEHASVHAEIAAMRRAKWPRKVDLYVARINGAGEGRLSRPCANCQMVLDEYQCRVVWTENG